MPKTSRRRLLRAHLIAGATRVLVALFRLLPWGAAQALGRGLGRVAWRLSRRDRRRALEHLVLAFPELPASEHERLARACFRHLGTNAGEVLWLMSRDCAAVARHVDVEGLDRVRALREQGQGIMFVTGHCGNWELLAAAANCSGLRITVAVRGLDEPPLQGLIAGLRTRFGTRMVERGEPGAARELLRGLREGALGLLIDQDTRVEGVWVPFFGRPAHTPVGAARLALRRNTAVVPAFIERREDGSHRAWFDVPLTIPEDEVEATAVMTRAIEEQVRRRPEQWVWMHRRWRTQPEGAGGAG
jgi:KDO2-lipid IV(A) lauroyltransferase